MAKKLFRLTLFFLITSAPLCAQNVNYQKYSVDGDVNAILTEGNTLILGGNFTSVGVFSSNMVKLPFSSPPAPDLTYPKVIGSVLLSTSDNAGGVYIYGNYYRENESETDGHTRIEHILANGTWEEDFSWPVETWTLSKIFYHESKLYISGYLVDTINGQSAGNICAIDTETEEMETWLPLFAEDAGIGTFAISDNKLFFSGNFTEVSGQPRQKNAAIELYSGDLTAWDPAINDGFVDVVFYEDKIILCGGFHDGVFEEHAVALVDKATGQSVQYLFESGGLFGGDPQYLYWAAGVSRLAIDGDMLYAFSSGTYDTRVTAINLQTGSQAWTKYFNMIASCQNMLAYDGKLYIAGEMFDEIFTTNLNNDAMNFERKITGIVTLDAATGNMSPWQADIMGTTRDAYCLTLINGGLFAGGKFTHVTGFHRRNICMIDTGTNTVLPFKVDFDWTEVYALKIHENKLFVGGSIGFVGATEIYKPLLAFDMGTADMLPWQPELDGTAFSLEQSGTKIFASGNIQDINNERHGLFAIDIDTATTDDWNPDPVNSVWSLHINNNILYAGGNFTEISGQSRTHLCSYNVQDLTLTGWAPVTDGDVSVITSDESSIWVGGSFNEINGTPAASFAGIQPSTGALTHIPLSSGLYGNVASLLNTGDMIFAAGSVYVPGTEDQCNNIKGYNKQTEELLSEDAFCINFENLWYGGIFSMGLINEDLYFGGRFLKINREMNTMHLANMNIEEMLSNPNIIDHSSITVYPNPATDKVKVISWTGSMITGINLFDINGRQLSIDHHATATNEIELELKEAMPHGLYILEIKTPEKVYSEKIIIK